MTYYIPLFTDLDKLQTDIMVFIGKWARENPKAPVAQKAIVKEFDDKVANRFMISNALHALVKKGYIRSSLYREHGKQAAYVQLRGVSVSG